PDRGARGARAPLPGRGRQAARRFHPRDGGAVIGAVPRSGPAPRPSDDSPLLPAEQVLLDARRGEDVVARILELLAQARNIDVEQLSLPLAHLARDDHRLDVGAI